MCDDVILLSILYLLAAQLAFPATHSQTRTVIKQSSRAVLKGRMPDGFRLGCLPSIPSIYSHNADLPFTYVSTACIKITRHHNNRASRSLGLLVVGPLQEFGNYLIARHVVHAHLHCKMTLNKHFSELCL